MIRLLHVDQNADAKNFRFGDCDAWLVGRDGIWRRNGPVKLNPIYPRKNFKPDQECGRNPNTIVEQYLLPGATRADIVLSCPADTVQTVTIDCEPVMTIETEEESITQPHAYGSFLEMTAENNGFTTMYEARPDYIHDAKSGLGGTSSAVGQYVALELSAQDVTDPAYDGPYKRMSPNVVIDPEEVYLFDLENGQNGHVSAFHPRRV